MPVDVFKDAAAKARFAPGPTIDIARVGYGVIVRAGAPKPDLSTPDALKKTLLERAIGRLPAGKRRRRLRHQDVRAARDRRGDEGQDQGRRPHPPQIAPAVAKGEAELGVFLTNVLIAPGVELAGPFPRRTAAGTGLHRRPSPPTAKEADAAKALIDFLENARRRRCTQGLGHDTRSEQVFHGLASPCDLFGRRRHRYGAVTDNGIVDLSARFGKEYPTLREAIAAGALMKLAEDAARRSPDHALDAITWQPPIPAPEKIICIGVNYPDRNAEYKDGRTRQNIRACSCARRAPLSATTRRWSARAPRRSSTMRASWC